MKALWLDYRKPAPGRRRPGLALLGAGLLAVIVAWVEHAVLAGGIEAAQFRVAALRSEALQASSAEAAAAAGAGGPVAARHSAAEWEAMLSSLEAAADDSVTLLGLRPGANEIEIAGEAKDFAASADYVERLQSSVGLARPRMTQSELVADHPQRPVRFALVAQWREGPK